MESNQLEMLLSYTTFHIGLYVTLFTALIGVSVVRDLNITLMRFSVACFLVAGICGGVIGSNIPEYANFATFEKEPLGVWGLRMWNYQYWARIEHFAFWLGVLPIVGLFIFNGPDSITRHSK